MNATAYITTRNHETDAAYLNAQGLRVTIETTQTERHSLRSQCRVDTCANTCTT